MVCKARNVPGVQQANIARNNAMSRVCIRAGASAELARMTLLLAIMHFRHCADVESSIPQVPKMRQTRDACLHVSTQGQRKVRSSHEFDIL
jgi:hypothetical protein